MKKTLLITHVDLDGVSPIILLNLTGVKFVYKNVEIADLDETLHNLIDTEEINKYEQIYITDLTVPEWAYEYFKDNNINIKVEIAEKTGFEEKSVGNSFDTSTATDEEINAKKEQVLKNWNDFSSKNENKISQLYTALSIYVGSMTQMDGDYTANE